MYTCYHHVIYHKRSPITQENSSKTDSRSNDLPLITRGHRFENVFIQGSFLIFTSLHPFLTPFLCSLARPNGGGKEET